MASPAAWIEAHKGAVAAGGAGLVGVYALYRSRKASAAGGATPAGLGSSAATPSVSGGFGFDSSQLDQYNQLAGAISNLNDQVGLIQAHDASAAVATLPPASGGGIAPASPFNPYPIGTVVAPSGEKITEAIPVGSQGFVDVTNMGGLYTTGGLTVPGSAYTGTAGNYSAQVSGSTVYEYTPTGVKTYSLAGVK